MTLKLASLGLVGLLIGVSSAWALVTIHGKEPVHVSSWSEPVDRLINHPARVQGRVGPLAPQAEFDYEGTPEVLNGLLIQYAAIPGRSSVVYLTTGSMPGPLAVRSAVDGTVTVWIRITEEKDLKLWKIPKGLGVEQIDVPGALPHLHRTALEDAVAKFVHDHPAPPNTKDSPAARRF